jgi:hypothetical protein
MHTDQARILAAASVLQWDEWPSTKRNVWDAVVKLLTEIERAGVYPYTPKVIVCYGDFRQIPPVVKGASRESIVRNSVRHSSTWPHFIHHILRTSHRQREDPDYARWIEKVGNGTAPATHSVGTEAGFIRLDLCDITTTTSDAISFCFPHLNDPHACANSRIVATTNEGVNEINDDILNELVQTYKTRSNLTWRPQISLTVLRSNS